VIGVSAREGTRLDELKQALAGLLPSVEELARPTEIGGVVVHRFDSADAGFSIDRDGDGVLRVRGRRVERLAAQTNFDNEESAIRFQRELARIGVERALERAGVGSGELVRVGSHELEWQPEAWR